MAALFRRVFGRLVFEQRLHPSTSLIPASSNIINSTSSCNPVSSVQLLLQEPLQNCSSYRPTCQVFRRHNSSIAEEPQESRVTALRLNEDDFSKVICENITSACTEDQMGRLFAVIAIGGAQRKITTEDIICVEGQFYPQIGDRIKLEKVLLVGSKDFTVLGRPILKRHQTTVEATVIEKTLETIKPFFVYRRKRNFNLFRLLRKEMTMLRINKIELHKE